MMKALAALALLLLLPAPQEREWRILIGDEGFMPRQVSVNVGDTVVWMNVSDEYHSVAGEGFDSGPIEPGTSKQRVFRSPGDFAYVCEEHPDQTGVVVVRERD